MLIIITTVLLAAAVLALLAIVMACILGWANVAFHVEVDPKIEAVNEALPGANCGGCGYVGCGAYAEAVAKGEAVITLCGPGGAGCIEQLAEIMGVSATAAQPYRAAIHCAAVQGERLQRMEYHGEQTCAAANLVSGIQGCTYGCLGLGDCSRVCEYDAIHVKDLLAVVDYDKCIGCRACEMICPRNIITMVPMKSEQMLVIACSNADSGKDVKAVCEVGCIGCSACARVNDSIEMDGKLPVIDYNTYDPNADLQPALDKCRVKTLFLIGKANDEDMVKIADEEMPDQVKAEFKTTVDDTEWRG